MERRGSSGIDAALRRIAQGQSGLITWRQVREVGVGRTSLDRRCEAGHWQQVYAGVFRTTAVAPTVEQRLVAAALALPGGVLMGPSAGFADALPVEQQSLVAPVVAVPASRSARTRGVTTVRLSVDLPSRPWRGVRVTTPAATIVTLPRFVSPARLERCLDDALARRLTTVERVRALLEQLPYRSVTGRPLLLSLLDGRSERGLGHRSWCEQDVGTWLDEAGLGGWQANALVDVATGPPIECDLVWRPAKVNLEVSPFATHGSRRAHDGFVCAQPLLGGTCAHAARVDGATPAAEQRESHRLGRRRGVSRQER